MSKQSIGVITVATNIYIDYWKAMALSFDKHVGGLFQVNFHVFTDRIDVAREQKLPNGSDIFVHQIPNLGWPEASLNFFEIVSENKSLFSEDVLINLDADMKLNKPFDNQFNAKKFKRGIALVLHPGFYENSWHLETKSLSTIKKLLKKIRHNRSGIERKNRGTWETSQKSQAFVPESRRKNYFCGGSWMGRRKEFLTLIDEIAQRVRLDKANNVLAIWHDESHLNEWASRNRFTILDASYCYYPQLLNHLGLENIIEAVDKGEYKTR